jgi:hypothetical protein
LLQDCLDSYNSLPLTYSLSFEALFSLQGIVYLYNRFRFFFFFSYSSCNFFLCGFMSILDCLIDLCF